MGTMDDLIVRVETNLEDVRRAVKLAGRVRVLPNFRAKATGSALRFDVELEAELEQGRFTVQWLKAVKRPGGDGVTNEGLRLVPVARILQHAVEEIVVEGDWGPDVVDWGPAVLPKRTPRSGPEDEVLILVAVLYRLAYMVSVPPTAYVAERLGLPQSTAGRWVSKARKARHLGPAVGTKAGEGDIQ